MTLIRRVRFTCHLLQIPQSKTAVLNYSRVD